MLEYFVNSVLIFATGYLIAGHGRNLIKAYGHVFRGEKLIEGRVV